MRRLLLWLLHPVLAPYDALERDQAELRERQAELRRDQAGLRERIEARRRIEAGR